MLIMLTKKRYDFVGTVDSASPKFRETINTRWPRMAVRCKPDNVRTYVRNVRMYVRTYVRTHVRTHARTY